MGVGPPNIHGVTIERRLAVGGMAELFLGRQVSPGGDTRAVVVKCLLPGVGEEAQTLFGRERRVLGGLKSPHVVALLGSGDGYLVLEHVDGLDLRALLAHYQKRGRCLPIDAARVVIEGLGRALADLHAASGGDGQVLGLVHRDVNPSNLLISRDGAVKLADLGVVHQSLGAASTLAGVKGTLAYMAPEQLQGLPVDARTDLFAAGLVAYEVLTGVPARPAGMAGVAELLQVRLQMPARPSELRPELPGSLDGAVLRALEPIPADRPASAEAWLAALAPAFGGGIPDPLALARAVAPALGGSPRVKASTFQDVPTVATPSQETTPRAGWVSAVMVAGGVGIAGLMWYAWPGPAPPSWGPPPTTVLATPTPSPTRAIDVPPAPDATPDAVERAPQAVLAATEGIGPEVAPVAEVPEVQASPLPAPPKRPPVSAAPSEVALTIQRGGTGSVHVAGAGFQGLAPQSATLGQGRHVVQLTGGGGQVRATLALEVRGDAVGAAIGTSPGTYLEVACNGRELGPTPVKGLAVAPHLKCRLLGSSGAELGFQVTRP
jgi:hypothetical protein